MTVVSNLPTGVAAVFWGVITFSLLVVLHEGGHFLAARAFKVKVHEFMLGLPGPALRWRSKRTGISYGVTAIPLGGYVRIAGMEPGPEDELLGRALGLLADRGTLDAPELASDLGVERDRASALLITLTDYGAAEDMGDWPGWRSLVQRADGESDEQLLDRVRSTVYRGQRPWKRITILAMGVIVNLVTALVVFAVVLTAFGEPVTLPVVATVSPDTAAAQAGIRPGETITSIGGDRIRVWDDVPKAITSHRPGDTVVVRLTAKGRSRTVTAKLGSQKDPEGRTIAFLGVGGGAAQKLVRLPLTTAIGRGFTYIGLTFVAIGQFFDPRTFAQSVGNARSVVGISYMVAQAAETGPYQYAWLIAVLSLSLGAMNILPIPPLDGGKVTVELVEAALQRPLPKALSYALSAIGTLLLFSLIFYLMYADVLRYVIKAG